MSRRGLASRAVDVAHDVVIGVVAAVFVAVVALYAACYLLLTLAVFTAPLWIVGLAIWLVVR